MGPYTTIALRTSGKPAVVSTSVAAAIRSLNPDYPMTRVRPMDQVVSESLVTDRFALVVFGSPSQLYNVGAIDVRALIAVIAMLLASALLACYVPARRATKIDAMTALRQE